ncbi:MAG: hypothetical protein H6991_02350 [Pseudomonadales bacterium]|nr:hypothetical protein [Pseudomonadales bacterium]
MKYLRTVTAASVLAFSAVANAEVALSPTEMDGVNAAGFAFADAVATALGGVTSAFTNTAATTQSVNILPGQFGAIFEIVSAAAAEAASNSDGNAVAAGVGAGQTQGTLLSDTESMAATATDTTAVLPFAAAAAWNTSLASSIIVGLPSAAASASASAAALAN